MLTASEKRFIRSWEDQRKGGRWSYYLVYIFVGAFICSLIISIFLFLFFHVILGSKFLWFVFMGGTALSITITLLSWNRNEKKFRQIIRREVAKGIREEG